MCLQKKKIMNIQLSNDEMETGACAYRLFCGDRYIIAKGKTLAGSIYLIQKGYAYFIAGGGGTGTTFKSAGQKEGDGKNTYYAKFYRFVKKNPRLPFRVEVILMSENGYQLLKAEQLELNSTIRDKKCLNNNIASYIPKYRKSTKSYGWISVAHVLNFKRFLARI